MVLLSTPATIIHNLTLIQHTSLCSCGSTAHFVLCSSEMYFAAVFIPVPSPELKSEVFFRQLSPLNHLVLQSTYKSVAQGFFKVLFEITVPRTSMTQQGTGRAFLLRAGCNNET